MRGNPEGMWNKWIRTLRVLILLFGERILARDNLIPFLHERIRLWSKVNQKYGEEMSSWVSRRSSPWFHPAARLQFGFFLSHHGATGHGI